MERWNRDKGQGTGDKQKLMDDMENDEPQQREVTFDGGRLTVILIAIIIPFYFLGDKVFHFLWENRIPRFGFTFPMWSKVVSVVLAVAMHELIHGLFFALYAPGGFKSVTFGVSRTMGAIYCHCSDPVKVKHYRRAGIAPLIILGLIPYFLALYTGNTWFKTFGLLLSIGGFGDLLIWIKLLKLDANLIIRDHPEKLGFMIEGEGQEGL